VDQASATIIAAVIAVSGTVTAAIIAVLWKGRAPEHHIQEYRIVHQIAADSKPWIRGGSWLARIVRALAWLLVFATILFGVTSLFLLGDMWFEGRLQAKAFALLPAAILALLVGWWISKRIDLPREDDES
jgi:hypothetical protein